MQATVRKLPVNFKLLDNFNAIATKACNDTRKKQADIRNVEDMHRYNGTYGCSAMVDRIQNIELEYSAARAESWNNLQKAYDAFKEHLADIASPHAEDINDGDAMLLRDRLIRNEAELERLYAKHSGNETMRRMIEQYAKDRKWDGFEAFTNYDTLAAFADARFKMAQDAIISKDPDSSYSAMFMAKHVDSALDFANETEG